MHNEPLISVIIYIKKSADGLKKCLNTLSLQMYKNIEVICVEDVCLAGNNALLSGYKNQFKRFEIIYQTNLTAVKAWNEGLKTAQGQYVHFINSDCWLLLDLYKVFTESLTDKESEVSIINSSLYNGDIIDIPFYELYDDEDFLGIADNLIHSHKDIRHIMTKNLRVLNKIYKKEFLVKNNLLFTENNIYSEYLFNIQSLLNSSSVYINPDVYMRHTEQNIAEGAFTEKVFDIFDAITKIQEYLISENYLREYVFDFFNFICNSLEEYYKYCPNDLKPEYFGKMKQFVLSRFNSMPPDIQNNYRKIEEVNFLITSNFEEYNSKKS